MKRLAVLLTLLGIAMTVLGCSNAVDSERTLRVSGFKNIHITGYAFWGCSKGDGTCTGFEATAPDGEQVHGVVGCGYFFKGCTIRLK